MRYRSDVAKYNREKQPKKPMKAPVLSLRFRDNVGYVTVLQSARYIMVEDEQQAQRELLADEEFWQACGWQTLRRKLETTVHGKIQGLPSTVEEAIHFGDGGWYFESHIKVRSDSAENNNPDLLQPLCDTLTMQFGWPVVLSYSSTEQFDPDTGTSLGVPRFLNLRMRSATVAEFLARVKMVCNAINSESVHWKVEKTIDEAVISDSWPAMDDGWINWNKNQLVLVCGSRMTGKSTLCADVTKQMRAWGLSCKTMRISDIVKAEYLKLNHLPPNTFDSRTEKEKHRPGLLKLLDAKTDKDPLFAARALCFAVDKWRGRGTIFVDGVRYPHDVEYIKAHAADTFDVCPVLLCPSEDVRISRGWVYDTRVDDHESEHAFKNVNPADFVCFNDVTNVATHLFEHLKKAHHL
jgi:phosphomevalonate kinase